MPRTEGSKNHPKSDFASQIAEKQSVIYSSGVRAHWGQIP